MRSGVGETWQEQPFHQLGWLPKFSRCTTFRSPRKVARLALGYHQWMAEPDFDQEGEIQRAEAFLAGQPTSRQPLLAAAVAMRGWIDAGASRCGWRRFGFGKSARCCVVTSR
jgi:hypothetical protein